MKNERLINAFGQIDESYISEAAPGNKVIEMTKKEMNKERKKAMNTKKTTGFFKKPMAAAAAILLCVCVTGVTALAAAGGLQGYFKDIFGWNGAVVGTKYEQASEEVEMKLAEVTDQLTVELVMLHPGKVPYSDLETLGVGSYRILDMDNREITKGNGSEMVKITDDKVFVNISLEGLSDGNYKLVVSELTGGKKGDQPLALSGSWECAFVK